MNVLSTFNGMGCIWYALDRAGIKVNKRYSSEIDKYANQSNDIAYPDTIHLGDITSIKARYIENIDLFVGGSPCQGFSFAGKQLNFNDPRSALFFEYVRLWNEIEEINPNAKFILENVNMKKEYLRVISEYMGVFPVRINSNLVSAQNRDRWYWTNIKTKKVGLFCELWSDIPQPEDKGIMLKDVLQPESEVDDKYYLSDKLTKSLLSHANNRNQSFTTHADNGKAKCITVSHLKQNLDSNYVCVSMIGRRIDEKGIRKDNNKNIPAVQRLETNTDGKTNCITSVSKDNLLTDGYRLRRLTPIECGKLQTFKEEEVQRLIDGGLSDTQLYKQFGNGWTIDIFTHMLSYIQ